MSTTLYYRIVKPVKDKFLSDNLKYILKEKFDLSTGDVVRLNHLNIEYLRGLADANVDGAKTLVNAIEKYQDIEIYIGN